MRQATEIPNADLPSEQAEDSDQRRAQSREQLEQAARSLLTSEGWERWIELRRHNGLARYSFRNQMLLSLQMALRNGTPSYVAGYRWWAEHGYQVRKGEKSLRILGPIRRKVEDEATGNKVTRVVGFRDVAVFDRSQVDAGPGAVELAPPLEPVTGDSHVAQLEPLLTFASSIGLEVSFVHLEGVKGFFDPRDSRIVLDAGESPNARLRTLLHELAHALVTARGEVEGEALPFSYAEEEVVVECAGHVAAGAAGLDTSGEAVCYLAYWSSEDQLDTVQRAAEQIDSIARRLENAMGLHHEPSRVPSASD